MADSFIGMPTDGAGKKVRTQSRVVGTDTVHESYVINTDPTDGSAAAVKNTVPGSSDYGLVVRRIDPPRTQRSFTVTDLTPAATADTILTMTPVTNFVAGSTGTSFAITSGKTFRIQAIFAQFFTTAATATFAIVRIRVNPSAAATVAASAVIAVLEIPGSAAAANTGTVVPLDIPEGLDIPFGSGAQLGASLQVGATTSKFSLSILGYEY